MDQINYQEIYNILDNEVNNDKTINITLLNKNIDFNLDVMSEYDFNELLKDIAEQNISNIINYIKYNKCIKYFNKLLFK
jgi:hypothetical protein